jgi:predicted RNase H-like nuclease (RuvC/YqgF family)
MKKIFLIAICLFFFGCKINPNKEARIQKLETEIKQSIDKINKLESRVEVLEDVNHQLKRGIIELENQ